MEKPNTRLHDENNGLDYVLVGDYYFPALILAEDSRPVGRWGYDGSGIRSSGDR